MVKTILNKESKDFYNNLYSEPRKKNPALLIYDKLRIDTIHKMLGKSDEPILIVGSGSSNDYSLFRLYEDVYAFDLSINAIRSTEQRDGVFVADAIRIPVVEKYFQTIICSEVLEHIENVDAVLSEFDRIIKPDGKLIVSSPNWISLFGLARFLGQHIFKKAIHSDDQPYDDWMTWWKYKRYLGRSFKINIVRGVWYLPPLHFRNSGLSSSITQVIYKIFSPFEFLFSRLFPIFGHLIIISSQAKKRS